MANTQLRTLNEGSESYPHFLKIIVKKLAYVKKIL